MNRSLLPLAFVALLGSSLIAGAPHATAAEIPSRTPLIPLPTGGEYAVVVPGSSAPDFAYETLTDTTARLRDLRAQGHVLLVFGADDSDLRRLNREGSRLTRLGVVPVAVLDWRVGACRDVVRRLSLTFPVVPDPQRTIGAQYNVLDPNTRHDSRAWFVVDRGGRVRGLERFEHPGESWENVAATALGLPLADSPVPASTPAK